MFQTIVQVTVFTVDSQRKIIFREDMKFEEIEHEAQEIAKSGIGSILLLTGEAKGLIDKEYLKGGIDVLKKYFSSVSIEVMPLDEEDYNLLETQAKFFVVTKNEFVRVLIRKNMLGDIQELNENLKDIFRLKVSIGNNLNQIAKKCNSKTISDFREIQKELDDLWQSLKR